jgi:glycosyltransferase involved in cell wall biosynthesis
MSQRPRPIHSFTVVTPCFQAERHIAATVESVLGQTAVAAGRVRLEYLICDGGSTDRTLEIVHRLCGGRATVLSEEDRGLYDAVAKGLRRASGDVVAYLNAGDIYHPAALDVVADIFETGRVRWLTGHTLIASERGEVVQVRLPYRFRRDHVRKGLYGTVVRQSIQQDATFWDRSLHRLLDLDELAGLRLAGDFYLWRRFAEEEELHVVDTHLSTLLVHAGQLSEDADGYRTELRGLAEPHGWWDVLLARWDERRARHASPSRLSRRDPQHLWRFDWQRRVWRTRGSP